VEKYGRAGQAEDENEIWRMRFARKRIMTTVTFRKYNIASTLQKHLHYHTSI
jgi:hypothetical protein